MIRMPGCSSPPTWPQDSLSQHEGICIFKVYKILQEMDIACHTCPHMHSYFVVTVIQGDICDFTRVYSLAGGFNSEVAVKGYLFTLQTYKIASEKREGKCHLLRQQSILWPALFSENFTELSVTFLWIIPTASVNTGLMITYVKLLYDYLCHKSYLLWISKNPHMNHLSPDF